MSITVPLKYQEQTWRTSWAGVSCPQFLTTAQEHFTTFLAFPSWSILQRPAHSPSFMLESTWYKQELNIDLEYNTELNFLNLFFKKKELSFCHKLKFSNPFISATGRCNPLIFQTWIICFTVIHSLKYPRSMSLS